MNTDVRKIAIIVVLAVAFVGVLWWQMRPSEEERRIRENFAKSQTERATGQTQSAVSPSSQTAAPVDQPAAGGTQQRTGQSVFKKSNVDLDALLASVKEVDFDYQKERTERNPMRPLVGKSTPSLVAGGIKNVTHQAAEAIARTMRVTGIVYDRQNPLAVINDQVVYRGYAFDANLIVEDIEPTRVLLRANDAVIPIEMEGP